MAGRSCSTRPTIRLAQPLSRPTYVSSRRDACRSSSRTRTGCAILVETRISARVLQELSAKGHQLDLRKEHSMLMGRGQAVLHNSRMKVNYGASDSRADGAAVPEPLP